MIGYPFTWEKSKGTTDWVEECLDHGMASQSWLFIFSNSIVYSIEASESDHLPIFLDPRQLPRRNRHQRFRFENMWLREPECGVVVKNSWESLPGETIQDRIQICGHALAEWGRSLGRDFRLQISDCKNSMAHYRGKKDSSSSEEFVQSKQRYIILLDKKEAYWKQRAKQDWLAEGDTNTRFFYSMASARQRRNRITRLKDDFGKWHSIDNGVEELIVDYFETV